jgi:hypothetical protein
VAIALFKSSLSAQNFIRTIRERTMRDTDRAFGIMMHRTQRFFEFPVNFPVSREMAAHKNGQYRQAPPLEIARFVQVADDIARRFSAYPSSRVRGEGGNSRTANEQDGLPLSRGDIA